jgi:phosphate starvation-inducible PhoH-like protein
LEAIAQHDVVLALGPAGTGKTWLAVAAALAALQRREVRRIVLTRPAVEAGENLGFLPGDLQEKVSPYLRPLYDALKDLIDPDKVTRLLERGQIEAAPLAFMRGRTLSSAFVILDEAQNTTPEQMLMLLTRLGEHTKMVVCGDPDQTDLRYGQQSGLAHAQRVLQGVEGIGLVQLDRSDVVRHPLVGRILQAYDVERANRPANQTGNRYGDRNAERRGG